MLVTVIMSFDSRWAMGKWSLFVQVRRSHDVAFINKWQMFVTYTSGGNKAFDPVWANPRASNTMTKRVPYMFCSLQNIQGTISVERPSILKNFVVLRSCS